MASPAQQQGRASSGVLHAERTMSLRLRVFISYCSQDRPVVQQLVSAWVG
jgi:hypothetical protein